MWAQYKKTFFWVQGAILMICALFIGVGHAPFEALIGPFVVMEIGAIYGAKWAWRIKGGHLTKNAAV